MQIVCRYSIAIVILVVVSVLISACSPQRRQQAEMTVLTADSLRAAGQYYNDSAALAEAVSTLRPLRFFRRNSYAHACYHYGRLLIDSNHPLPAVEQLLQAEHYTPRDYSLLGRVYSNLANVCLEAEQYEEARSYHSLSSERFLQAGDSLSFYYELMFKVLDEGLMGQYDSAITSLQQIRKLNPNQSIRAFSYEIQSFISVSNGRYQESLLFIDSAAIYGISRPKDWTNKATSYHYLGQKDSALFYAEKVASAESGLQNLYSAYYILTNDNPLLEQDSLLSHVAYRADVGEALKEYKSYCLQAYEHMVSVRQNLKIRRLYQSLFSLLLSGILLIVLYYFVQKSRHKRKRYQQLEDTCRTLCTYSNLEHEIHWNDYQTMCDFIDLKFDHIITKLQTITTLKELDVRLCVLVLIGLQSKAIAEMMHYSPKSIGRIKENVANKLGIHGSQLRGYMLQIMGF